MNSEAHSVRSLRRRSRHQAMQMQYKSFAITGATGQQGGSILQYLTRVHPEAEIRAVTRDISKPSARALLDLGPNVKLVRGDLADKQSMKRAFEGVEVVFLITDYWHSQDGKSTVANLNTELMDGITGIDAARETQSLKHFLFGTLIDFASIADVEYRNIYHFSE